MKRGTCRQWSAVQPIRFRGCVHRASRRLARRPVAPLKVAYLLSMFPCWSETFILRELVALQRRGVDVTILSLKPCSESLVHPEASLLLHQGRVVYASQPGGLARFSWLLLTQPMRVLNLMDQFRRSFRGSWRSLAKSFSSMVLACDFIPILQAQGRTHIHAPWATYPSTAAWFCSRMAGFSFSFTSHAHDLFLEDHGLALKFREAHFAQTISEYNRSLIRRRYLPTVSDTLHVIHCGLDPGDYSAPHEPSCPALLLSVGRMVEMKGFVDLIEACAQIRDKGIAFQCRIVGDGPLKRALEERIDRRGLSSLVQLCEPLSQSAIRELLLKATCFVLPCVTASDGDQDGIPTVLMEAMAARVPVISCATSGVPELVQHGVTGLLATPRDPASLAQQIERLLVDPALRQRLAAAGRVKVENDFEIGKNVARLAGLFPLARA